MTLFTHLLTLEPHFLYYLPQWLELLTDVFYRSLETVPTSPCVLSPPLLVPPKVNSGAAVELLNSQEEEGICPYR